MIYLLRHLVERIGKTAYETGKDLAHNRIQLNDLFYVTIFYLYWHASVFLALKIILDVNDDNTRIPATVPIISAHATRSSIILIDCDTGYNRNSKSGFSRIYTELN